MQIHTKVVLITGASEGLGAALARAFAARGARLSLNVLREGEVPMLDGTEPLVTPGDIADDAIRHRLVAATLVRFGSIDILVNNVGVGLFAYPSVADLGLVRRLFETNVFSALAMAQLVAPLMKERRSGTIVNIGSVGGRVTLPWASIYSATKYALHSVNDGLRRELQPYGVRVMLVSPGIIDTKFREHALAGKAPGHVDAIRRVITADQCARAVVRGVERDARVVYVPWLGRAFVALDFFFPRLMDAYLRSKAR